ncbi:MAG TPA: DoxX family protein [Amaricoccus sp.]|uniref:DoxX family protein n=1 Tax=Amaricoccus sp. TaxID=1872485 RepID=UPI001D5AEE22|nr:DoxX family protein [Amaricoccus sp.]MCB1403233.1 DoxX family protein [Paracoccaceae bacterium]MCC0068239.1 DoxX family protein [Rhodovulum sp.]HPG23211.1 DoxX family protein [Amaricoccus sp.]HRW15830.1 DoxX family protein [Amaricoccus sp.]
MINLSSLAALAGRVLIALVFIPAGFGKFGDIAGTMAYTASGGLPGVFGLGAGALELLGGLAILVGWQTRWAALGLAGFALLAGYLYHYIPAQGLEGFDAVLQTLMFQKNLAIAGGLLILAGLGAGGLSLDARQGRLVAA